MPGCAAHAKASSTNLNSRQPSRRPLKLWGLPKVRVSTALRTGGAGSKGFDVPTGV